MAVATRSKRPLEAAKTETVKRLKTEVGLGDGDSITELKQEGNTGVKSLERKHIKVEVEDESSETSPNVFRTVTGEDLKLVGLDARVPLNWHEIYNEIVYMRSKFMAPVDTMGCERMPETITPNVTRDKPKVYRFQLLISLMLSSQTKDEVNFEAMVNLQTIFLKKGYENGLCLEAILDSAESDIDNYIQKVGFHRKKAGFIKNSCDILNDQFNGDIPKTIEDIVSLPGVGPKMGYLLLQKGWNINDGIGVDVHLHRLAQMWGWVSKSDKPENTRNELEKWLPKSLWADINPLLVGFGQSVCAPRSNNCDICTLAKKGLCKSSNKKLLKQPIDDKRKAKLQSQRSDMSGLIDLF